MTTSNAPGLLPNACGKARMYELPESLRVGHCVEALTATDKTSAMRNAHLFSSLLIGYPRTTIDRRQIDATLEGGRDFIVDG